MTNKYDVIVSGAGLVGMTMAVALAARNISVVVIEASDLNKINAKESDGRTCAISGGSSKIFEDIGAWQYMLPEAGPIFDIRVTDGNSPLFLHYDHNMVGDAPMGYIVENFHIRKALFQRAEELGIKIIDNASFEDLKRDGGFVTATLTNGETLNASLIIAADGRNSALREEAGIKSTQWKYKQCGIVCTVEHEKPHDGIAQERFLPAGPFAILPMKNPHHSSIVWTEGDDATPLFMKMDDEEFLSQMRLRFTDYLGDIKIVGKRFSYPLGLLLAKKYTDKRLALAGDAAHAMHPIAGQGFNLGIRDVPALVSAIAQAKETGYDVGSDDVLKKYEEARKFDNVTLLAITDGLNRLFSNDIMPVKIARRVGMAAVNKIPSLKKMFIKHAMGESGLV